MLERLDQDNLIRIHRPKLTGSSQNLSAGESDFENALAVIQVHEMTSLFGSGDKTMRKSVGGECRLHWRQMLCLWCSMDGHAATAGAHCSRTGWHMASTRSASTCSSIKAAADMFCRLANGRRAPAQLKPSP